MKVLIVHNQYRRKSGEEIAVQNEISGLRNLGHTVSLHCVSNANIDGFWQKLIIGLGSVYNFRQRRKVFRLLQHERPDIVHVHNYFPQFSASIFTACWNAKTPCIHTLHNYRSVCPSTTLFHDGNLYYESLRGNYLRAFIDRIYRKSLFGTGIIICSIYLHKWLKTWSKISTIIVLSEFQKKLISKEIDSRIVVLPNFHSTSPDAPAPSVTKQSDSHLFVGRLDHEKGILKLLEHWPENHQLNIVGEGPLKEQIESMAEKLAGVRLLGYRPRSELFSLIRKSASVIVPSVWHEPFGLVVIESFSMGTPVLVNKIEPLQELVVNGNTGYIFDIASSESLKSALDNVLNSGNKIRRNCLEEYTKRYSESVGALALEHLMQESIYASNALHLPNPEHKAP